jgi:hypothetical protein
MMLRVLAVSADCSHGRQNDFSGEIGKRLLDRPWWHLGSAFDAICAASLAELRSQAGRDEQDATGS